MKRILALASALVFTVLCTGIFIGVSAEGPVASPMKIRLLNGFEGKTIGEALTQGINGDTATAVYSDSLGALGSFASVTLKATEPSGYAEGPQVSYELFYPTEPNLSELTGLMVYVKMPNGKVQDGENIWYAGMRLNHYMYKDVNGTLKMAFPNAGNADFWILDKNGCEWQKMKASDGYMQLPGGFEGYVKLNLADLGNLNTDDQKDAATGKLCSSTFMFRTIGGDICGSAVVGGIYGVTDDNNSVTVLLGNDTTEKFLTTGKAVSSVNETVLNASMTGKVLQSFNSFPKGYDLLASKMVKAYNHVGIKAVSADKAGGIENSPSLELSSPTQGGFRDTGPFYEMHAPAYTYIDDMQAFMMYIKCAKPHKDDLETSRLKLTLYTNGSEGPKWTQIGSSGKIQYLLKGAKKWMTAQGDTDGIVVLPPNFEGYIKVDIADMKQNPIKDILAGRQLVSVSVAFHAVGGDAGNCYLDAMYSITNNTGKKDTLLTLNGCDVYNLVTGQLATEDDLKEPGPEIGELFDDIPESTTDKTMNQIGEADLTENSVKLSWNAFDGAVGYRVDVFTLQLSGDGLSNKYACVASEKVATTSTTIKGLDASTRYYVVVNALDHFDSVLGIYEYQRFATNDQANNDDDDNNGNDNDNDNDGGNGTDTPNVPTGIPAPMSAFVVLCISAFIASVSVLKSKVCS